MTMTDNKKAIEAFVVEHGEELRSFAEEFYSDPPDPIAPEDMTEGQRYLAAKMQSEHEVNAAAAAAGYESIFDLPSEDDDVLNAAAYEDWDAEEPDTEEPQERPTLAQSAQAYIDRHERLIRSRDQEA